MTAAELVDDITALPGDMSAMHALASEVMVMNGLDPLNAEHRRVLAIGALVGTDLSTLATTGLVRGLTYGMETP